MEGWLLAAAVVQAWDMASVVNLRVFHTGVSHPAVVLGRVETNSYNFVY
jgi:hypothetical protein